MMPTEHVIYEMEDANIQSQEIEEQVVEGVESVIVDSGDMLTNETEIINETVDNQQIVQLVVMSEDSEVTDVQMMES